MGLNAVSIPMLYRAHGLHPSSIASIASFDIVGTLMITVAMRSAVRRFGLGSVLLTLALLRVAALIFFPLADRESQWMALSIWIGVGGSGIFFGGQAWLQATVENHRRGTGLGMMLAICSLGLALGSLLGSLWGDYQTLLRLSVVVGGAIVVPIVLGWKTLPRYVPAPGKISVRSVYRKQPIALFGGLVSDYIFFSLYNFLVIYGLEIGLKHEQAMLFVTSMILGNMMLEIPIGWLSDRTSRHTAIGLSGGVILLSSLAMVWYGGHAADSFWILSCLAALLCGSLAGTYTASLAALGDSFQGEALLGATTRFVILASFGGLLGVNGTGLAMDLLGPVGLPVSMMVVMALYMLYYAYHRIRLWLQPMDRMEAAK